MSRPKTTDNRKRYDRLLEQIHLLDKSHVAVGVHEDAGSYLEANRPIAHIAAVQEFGTHSAGLYRNVVIPRRPWMRSAVDRNFKALTKLQERELGLILAGKQTVEGALDRIGFFLKTAMEKQIQTSSSWATPNAESVIARKKKGGALRGATPLIWRGLLLRSIAWKTFVGKPIGDTR